MTQVPHVEHEEVHQVIGPPPGMLLKSGMLISAVFFTLLLILSYFIKYPDEIVSKVVLTSENAVIRVFPKSTGQVHLLIKNNSAVNVGQPLAIIKNPAQFDDVQFLENQLKDSVYKNNNQLVLGSIQSHYSSFNESVEDFEFFMHNNTHEAQLKNLREQLSSINRLINSLTKRNSYHKELVALGQIDFDRNQTLYSNRTISQADFERIESNFLQSKIQLENGIAEMETNVARSYELQAQIIQLTKKNIEEERKRYLRLIEAKNNLLSQISIWKDQFLITSPVKGNVYLSSLTAKDQFVNPTDELMTINPLSSQVDLIARTFLKSDRVGKIKTGNKVIIQIDNYPYQEFGSIIGIVRSVSAVPSNKGYSVEIEINKSFTSTYQKRLKFTQDMTGTAKIIIENQPVIFVIFNSVKSLVSESSI